MQRLTRGGVKQTLPRESLMFTDLPGTGGGRAPLMAWITPSASGSKAPGGGGGDTVPGGAGAASSQRNSIGRVSPGARLSSCQLTPTPLSGAAESTLPLRPSPAKLEKTSSKSPSCSADQGVISCRP